MALALTRHPIDVDVYDTDAVRTWLMGRIENEVKLNGQARPRLLLLADGYEEALDLDSLSRREVGADAGATFQALRSRPHINRRFAIVGMQGEDAGGRQHSFSVLFEEIDDGDERRWWVAIQEYAVDPNTGLGIPAHWQPSRGETDEITNLFPFLRALAQPDPEAQPAQVLPPRQGQPDIQVAFGEVAADADVSDAVRVAEFANKLVTRELLTGQVNGNVVVRLHDRSWEQWVLGDELPTDLEDMIRYIVMREPRADAAALVQIAIRPQDNPPQPRLWIMAERDGALVEVRAPIEFPEGPAGRKVVTTFQQAGPRPVPEGGLWIGVDPMVNFELGPLGISE